MSTFQRLYEVTEALRNGDLEAAKKSAEEAVNDFKRFEKRVNEWVKIAEERVNLEKQVEELKYDTGWLRIIEAIKPGEGEKVVRKIEQIAKDREEMYEILFDFAESEPEPCRFDHHGYCQEHGWLAPGECRVARAKRVIERIAAQNESRPGG
jgi:hypothetical protein